MTLTPDQILANRNNLSADQCVYHLSRIHILYESLGTLHRLPYTRPGDSESKSVLRRQVRSIMIKELKTEIRREMKEAFSLWKLFEAHIGEIYAEDT